VLFIPFVPVGPTLDGLSGPIFPFWLFLDPALRGDDEGLTPTKDGGTCLRRLSMFRKEVHYPSSLSFVFVNFDSLS